MNTFDLSGRLAVVTGGASGIGSGIVSVLARAGAHVVVADCNEEGAARTAEALRAEGLGASHLLLDLADEASVVRGCAALVRTHGAPWALVNNAGLQDRQLLLDETVEGWERTLAVNTRGPFLMTRELARAMIAAQSGGRIVHIASAALIGALTTGHSAYAASKAALLGLMRANALELAPHGITVNAVLPGGVITPGAIAASGPKPEGPGCRPPALGLSEPEDIGAAVLFFASPAARKITNQALAVDAGWSIT